MTDDSASTNPAAGPGDGPPPASWPPQAQEPATWQSPPPEPGPAPGINFAPHGPRLIAYLLDGCLISLVVIVLVVVVTVLLGATVAVTGTQSGATGLAVLITLVAVGVALVISLAYFPYFWMRGGQTPGMKPFNLYVVRDSDGGPIDGATAVLRLLGLWVAGAVLYLGYIWVFIDPRRRGWHDLIAKTCVIERRR
ncbi:MAG TPA: RDD family protein [Candidatus Limnocylindrales bacterium]|nr:RDD family protein [Candidatus Limnocylindrales bacterium]